MAETPNSVIHNPRIRKAGYIILAAALSVLTVFEVITEDVADQIESLALQVAAIFGFTLAGANTPKSDKLKDQGAEQGM
ncbi:hypothetical protein [Nesterenkonia populi]|uniref:hypothetical protein n=1 Tax=Nesterenkonia populi TaxID=1591087 RepID=UPI0011BD9F04|nr:hypothetical protein [Nesterenkonia populi]